MISQNAVCGAVAATMHFRGLATIRQPGSLPAGRPSAPRYQLRGINNGFAQRLFDQVPFCRTTIPWESLNAEREISQGNPASARSCLQRGADYLVQRDPAPKGPRRSRRRFHAYSKHDDLIAADNSAEESAVLLLGVAKFPWALSETATASPIRRLCDPPTRPRPVTL